MATLVLSTVGGAIGGPIGGLLGAAIGNRIDHTVLGTRRKGARLANLSVQTSSYGSALPRLFGTMRVAGTVIWATDLREDSHRSGGGKGGGAATTYSYSANFAVALSARAIGAVRRIWADGKLLRGEAGDWKSEVAAFRLHLGDEDQAVDPLIASAEGLASAPAHRGIAYAVFDTLQLADFGNRIPSLTFEAEADEGAVEIGAIAAALSEGAIIGPAGVRVGGYAAGEDSVRGAIEALAAAYPLSIVDDGTVLRLGGAAVTVIDADELGARAEDKRESRMVRDRRAAGSLPDEVVIGYYEPARDYQAGLQRARRDGVALRTNRIDLPVAIGAGEAKGAAEGALARAWREREQATIRLPWRRMDLRAGQHVLLDGAQWRVTDWTLERMALVLGLVRTRPAVISAQASPGRATGGLDAPAGETVIELLDIPALGGGAAPRLWLAAAGTGAGWRRATASLSLDEGASWRTIGTTAPAATMGVLVAPLAAGPRELFDRTNAIEVELIHDAMTLPGGGEAALIAGQNVALVGDELIAFADAVQFAPRRWRLSCLLRGRCGSDWAMDAHAAGERFVLIEAGRLLPIDLPTAALGSPIAVSALGPGDAGPPATRSGIVLGRALRPPAPVALDARRLSDGTIRIGWIRRSRAGWAWLDGTDAPLGEDGELYRLTLASGGETRIVELATSSFDYLAVEQPAGLLAGTDALTVSVVQLGRFGASLPPATRVFTS